MEISNDKLNSGNNAALLPSLFGNHVVAKDGLLTLNDSTLTQQIEFILQDATITDNEIEQTLEHEQQTYTNPPNTTCASQQQSNNTATSDEQLLSGRGIIIQSTRQLQQQLQQQQQQQQTTTTTNATRIVDIEEDPELNDENLQDIEAETQEESEAELQHVDEEQQQQQQQQYQTVTEIKLEQYDNDLEQYTPTQLVLPSGTIVRTTTTTAAALQTLPSIQRQQSTMYISEVPNVNTISNLNDLTNTTTHTIINMPTNAVIRNVVSVVDANGTSIQLPNAQLVQQQQQQQQSIQQQQNEIPTSSIVTPVVVTNANHVLPRGVSIVPLNNVNNLSSTQIYATLNGSNNNNNNINSSAKKLSTKKSSKKSTSNHKVSTSSATSSTNSENITRTNGALLCIDCPERFDNKELFDIHRSGHINNMKCAICNMVLKSLKNYEKHCLRCKPYECQICGRVVRFRPNFIKHMRVHTACQAAERHKYKCEVCHKEFMSFEYFKVHKKIHSENVNLTCEICGKVFSALASLRGHSKLHSGHKLHKCEVCGKGFGQRYNLKIHARTHTGEFPYECSLCKKKLHTEKALESHMKVHQRPDENNPTPRNRTSKKSKNLITRTNAASEASSTRLERPSTSGLQQLCAIASDNLKNFNNQIDSTTMNDTTERETLTSSTMEDFSNDNSQDLMNGNYEEDKEELDEEEEMDEYLADNDIDEYDQVENDDEDDENEDDIDEDIINEFEEPKTSIRAPARTIVINNFVQNKTKASNVNSVPTSNNIGVITQSNQHQQQQQQQQQHTQVIQSCGSISSSNNINNNNNNNNYNKNSVLKQQLLRQTPIIQTVSSAYVVQGTGNYNKTN